MDTEFFTLVAIGDPAKKTWGETVASAARKAMDTDEPLATAVAIHLEFRMRRPRCHYLDGHVRAGAPWVPQTGLDSVALGRSTVAALAGVCYWSAAQICELIVHKNYAHDDCLGARIVVHAASWKDGKNKSQADYDQWMDGAVSLEKLNRLDAAAR